MSNSFSEGRSMSKSTWEDAVQKNPNKYRPHVNLAAEYLKLEKYALALHESQVAIKLFPDKIPAYINGMSAALKLEAYPLAYKYGTEIMNRKPMKDTAHNMAYLCQILGKTEEQKKWAAMKDKLDNVLNFSLDE